MAHQYEPFLYTHQDGSDSIGYPDTFDTDWDGDSEYFDRTWLEDRIGIADEFIQQHQLPLAINEFGVVRWAPDASEFIDDQLSLFESRGINYAIWIWEVSWEPFAEEITYFNTRLGPDPQNTTAVDNELQDVLVKYWSRNSIRPSQVIVPMDE